MINPPQVEYRAMAEPSMAEPYPIVTILTPGWIQIGGIRLPWNDAVVAFEVHRDATVQEAAMKKLQRRKR